MKKIIIPIIVVVAIVALIGGGYLVMDSLFPKADLINVPSASSVFKINVKVMCSLVGFYRNFVVCFSIGAILHTHFACRLCLGEFR